uniref:Uncharacterized protein n=1 Tax=Arundo donax TaxID=35708 RepID=A0A0A9G3R1_ARUDO
MTCKHLTQLNYSMHALYRRKMKH